MISLDKVSATLAWVDPWLAPWLNLLGAPVSQLEALAFVLSVWMVWGSMRVKVWNWPLAIASSVLYGLLFARSRLYGEAVLQGFFVLVSAWGWWQWWRSARAGEPRAAVAAAAAPEVRHLTGAARLWPWLGWLLLWPLTGALLHHITDSDVPYWDALPTAGSVVGQVLLARKLTENWPCWLLVNALSVGLFAYKQLWLTVVLYALFALLSVLGWRAWWRLGRASA
jgi:nicotinamide mononucleotide transporter